MKKKSKTKEPIVGIDISYYDWLKENKSILDEFDENIGILPKRLYDYIKKLDLLLSKDEFTELKRKTLGVLQKRYLEGIEQRAGIAIEQDEPSGLNITLERLCKDFDELLCSAEPKFRNVVENKPLDDLKEEKRNKVEKKATKKNEKLNNEELAKHYIELNIKTYPEESKLKDLAKLKGSKPTWSKKLRDKSFLFIVAICIDKKIKNSKTDTNSENQLTDLKVRIVEKLHNLETKTAKKKNSEILSDDLEKIENRSTQDLKESTNDFTDNIKFDGKMFNR